MQCLIKYFIMFWVLTGCKTTFNTKHVLENKLQKSPKRDIDSELNIFQLEYIKEIEISGKELIKQLILIIIENISIDKCNYKRDFYLQ